MGSDLFKIARAVDGDDFFAMRVRIACELQKITYNRDVLLTVAQEVAGYITVDEAGTVDTSGVPDEAIISALPAATQAEDEEAV
ncbi:MAG: hypothetical protein LKJ18_01845 [Ancrocorticia sp.]|jgi:D-hexose-6-phosphate mutarotase|nr:hypothetical protein [Ancrocorticia sp.]MCI1962881.1 hypothetical protein [Ancrocorticia sp.]MCI2001839.1 hypothetical protein [Ancrocorticia sp.]MCI2001892.1 hypothetical protein [Ancrocorticia sp.]